MSGAAMGKSYSHLSLEERCRLRGMIEMDLGISERLSNLSSGNSLLA